MGYAIELSFNIKKTPNLQNKQKQLSDIASEYNCECDYSSYEVEGNGRKIIRNDLVQVFMFSCFDDAYAFLGKVRFEKLAYIDCIYNDDISCDLLYASPKYIKLLNKPESLSLRRKLKSKYGKDEEITKIANLMKSR